MTTFADLKEFFDKQGYRVIIAAEAESRVHKTKNGKIEEEIPVGGVAVALDPIALASRAIYIARGKTEEDKKTVNGKGEFLVKSWRGSYILKRLFLTPQEYEGYYEGFSNQVLWPLCHITFERPEFRDDWYEAYKRVNRKFADAIKDEIKGKTFVWIHDYQLALVPGFVGKQKNTVLAMFWHIPWPTWEIFRIVPWKKELLESLLTCDFLAFHRGYQVRNFLDTVRRELEARIDEETGRIYYKGHVTTVMNLPLGIDADVIEGMVDQNKSSGVIFNMFKKFFGVEEPAKKENEFETFFEKNKVILGIDRLDYTKGLRLRLRALDKFFEKNPKYIGKVVYLGILSPSRENIPSYKELKKGVRELADTINRKYAQSGWLPLYLLYVTFKREDIVSFYQKADVCLVTPRDDGMNLVSKEFVVASAFSQNPGMLVLSQFAGSAIDLTSALIVNPYDIDEVAAAIKKALEMDIKEKIARMKTMALVLEEKNVYEWTMDFVKSAIAVKH